MHINENKSAAIKIPYDDNEIQSYCTPRNMYDDSDTQGSSSFKIAASNSLNFMTETTHRVMSVHLLLSGIISNRIIL